MSPVVSPGKPASSVPPEQLISEVEEFRKLCQKRYRFNSLWDNVLNVVGIAISLAIVVAGLSEEGRVAAVLGALVTALVTAQRAFPFNQRWQFYRLLCSQTENLLTEARNGTVTVEQTISTLKALRLDFAQQIPRGTSFRTESGSGDPERNGK